jgi:hypothetical protein
MTDLNATWNEAQRGPRMSEATGKVIFKYQMPVLEQFTMELPAGAQIIRMQDMDGFFWLWAVVDTDAPTEKRFFRAFKTGAKIPDDFDTSHYVGFCTVFVQMELGLYIFEDRAAYDQLNRIKDRFQVEDAPITKSATLREIAQNAGKKVIDIKLSSQSAEDFAGIPSFHVNEENARKWFKEATAWMYEDPKKQLKLDIDEVLSEFEDVLRPIIFPTVKKLTQKLIDEIEAAGGFEEDEE